MFRILRLMGVVAFFVIISGNLLAQNHFLSFTEGRISKTEINSEPERITSSKSSGFFEVEYNFPGCSVYEKNIENKRYDVLTIDGFSRMLNVGEPAVPAHNDIIALPGTSMPKIEIVSSEYQEYQNYYVFPALPPARDTEGAPAPEFTINEKVYNTDAFYPKDPVAVENVQKLRSLPLAVVQIRPVQFNPVTGTVRVYTSIKYRIYYESGAKSQEKQLATENTDHFLKQMKRVVLNHAVIPDKAHKARAKSDDKEYIIIAHSEYQAAADTLAMWKRQQGYSVDVVTQTSWTAAQVKDAIHNRYNDYTVKPDYFVIIGDHDGSYAVPGEVYQDPSYGDDYATDLYYACMDGGTDYYPDMAHGRISVSSASEAMSVILKIVNYERNPVNNTDFYTTGLNCAQFQDVANDEAPDGYAARRFCHTSEDIRDYVINEQGYSADRIYYTDENNTPTNFNNGNYSNGEAIPDELLKSNGFAWDGAASDITASINEGKFYVFHRDHGYSGGIGWAHPEFLSNNTYGAPSNISQLSNGNLLPVVFSINCHTGEFMLPNSFAEEFLRKEDGGAVGVVAASYYSYSGYNDGFSAGMIDAIWSDPGLTPTFGTGGISSPPASSANNTYTMGDVVNQGLVRMVETWGDNVYTHRLFHWFGDPAMKMWTANPHDQVITATIPEDVACDASSLNITGANIDGKATMVYDGVLLDEQELSGGSCTFNFTPLGPGDKKVIITITQHNAKPLIKKLTISGTCNYAPVAEFTADQTNLNTTDNQVVHLSDESLYLPESWTWTITPGSEGVDFEYIESTTANSENPVVSFATPGNYTVQLDVSNAHGNDQMTKSNYLTVSTGPEEIFSDDFETTTGWVLEGEFETGTPQGKGGEHGNPDPTTAFSGTNVLGVDLSGQGAYEGDYEPDLTDRQYYAISPVFDCSNYYDVKLSFARWLNVESPTYDHAYIDVSVDGGTNWTEVWTNAATIADNSWQAIELDISSYADGASEVQIRFSMGETDGSWLYSGWNIDDFTIEGISNVTYYNVGFSVTDGTDPIEGATVEFAGQEKLTDATGLTSFVVESGAAMPYTIRKAGFDNVTGSLDVTADMVENITMTPGQATYKVTFVVDDGTDPLEGANVNFNSTDITTDANGQAIFEGITSAADIPYTITNAGYFDSNGTLTVADANVSENVSMDLIAYEVTFTVRDNSDVLENAKVTLDGNQQLTNSEGVTVFESIVPAVDIPFSVKKAGYVDSTGTLTVTDAAVESDITLDVAQFDVTFKVTCSESGDPVDASITFSGTNASCSAGEALFQAVNYGVGLPYTLVAEGYHNLEGTVDVTENKTVSETMQLKKYEVSFIVKDDDGSLLEDAEVDFNEKVINSDASGVSLFKDVIPAAGMAYSVTKAGYTSVDGTLDVEDSNVEETVVLSVATGIDDLVMEAVNVYPNPVHTMLTIESEQLKQSDIILRDIIGKTVFIIKADENREKIDLSSLAKGIYLLEIVQDDRRQVQRIIVD